MLIRNLPQLAKIGTMGKEGVHSKKSIKKKKQAAGEFNTNR